MKRLAQIRGHKLLLTGPGWSSQWVRDQAGIVGILRTLALSKAGQSLPIPHRLLPRVHADWCIKWSGFQEKPEFIF